MASIHQMMEGAFEIDAIDKKTMREFEEVCLIPAPVLKPEEIKAIRESESVSQRVFARSLNVSKNLSSEWERGLTGTAPLVPGLTRAAFHSRNPKAALD